MMIRIHLDENAKSTIHILQNNKALY